MMKPQTKYKGESVLYQRREFLRLLGFSVLGSCLPLACRTPRQERPNIVLIFADDLGYGDLGCYGNQEVRTHNIDRIAARGIKLTDFYVTWPACTPSRSGLLTGRYPHRNGLFDMIRNNMVNYDHEYNDIEYINSLEMTMGLDLREITIAQVLQQAGYRTGIFGKWDSGRARRFLPLQRGFDTFYGFCNTGVDYYTHQRYGIESMYRGNHRVDDQRYATNLFRDQALKFIDDNHDKQFFLYLPFNAPHIASNLDGLSYQAPDEYIRMYGGEPPGTRRQRYLGSITCMDDAVGAIMDRLRSHGLEVNTLVIFTSDNGAGGPGENTPLRGGKSSVYEGGFRVPCVVQWPGGIPEGVVSNALTSTLDLFPTFAAIAGQSLPSDVTYDGYNLLSVLREQAESPRREMYWEARAKRAARFDNWKYILNMEPRWKIPAEPPDPANAELYD
ncbi:MAG TPA: sulfatase-like hydrolase/transferase, partial [bacterium]|nr:sulfatase-like hydrolase/transferase [bacterium]